MAPVRTLENRQPKVCTLQIWNICLSNNHEINRKKKKKNHNQIKTTKWPKTYLELEERQLLDPCIKSYNL